MYPVVIAVYLHSQTQQHSYNSTGGAPHECDSARLHLHCLGELPERVPFVLGSLRPPRVVAHATVPRRDRAISSRSVSSHASPHSSSVACCLHRHEPNRYRLMDDSAVNEQDFKQGARMSTIIEKVARHESSRQPRLLC